MHIYVGTLYSGENEFADCVTSIEAQSYNNYRHFVIKGLPQKEAHDKLFRDFIESGSDLLIHVGPDMVLMDDSLFSQVVNFFTENPHVQHYEIMVYDCLACQMIWGLNIYHDIELGERDENVFTDFLPIDPGRKVSDYGNLAPAAWHCPNPSLFQSFHYGAHKAVKIMESVRRGMTEKAEYYRDIIRNIHKNYTKHQDNRRAACLMGARFAIDRKLKSEHLNYTDPYLEDNFIALFGEP
jgi:hypothetical protein